MSSVRYHTAMSSAGVKNYFSTADYYTDGTETVGFWHGKLCRDMGVEPGSPTTKDAFGDLCDNINPATGKRLTLRTNEHRRVGTDFIFSLAKELSCIIEMCPDPVLREQLRAMVQKDVLAVVDVLEGDVETRVRKGGAEATRAGHGMIFAVHPHTTARGVGACGGRPAGPLARLRAERLQGHGRGRTRQGGRTRPDLSQQRLLRRPVQVDGRP